VKINSYISTDYAHIFTKKATPFAKRAAPYGGDAEFASRNNNIRCYVAVGFAKFIKVKPLAE
jgi:hypothetical protein